MRCTKDFATIHAYLCSDGYVVRNLPHQKHKYYRIGLRNQNLVLLTDFQQAFKREFSAVPKIRPGQRSELCSKKLYFQLTEKESFYCHEWNMPELSKKNMCAWIRACFDCEAWVELQHAKNRSIRIELSHLPGLCQVKDALLKLGIPTSKIRKKKDKEGYEFSIFGKENLIKYRKMIGFIHPDKKRRLDLAIADYVDYRWKIPRTKKKLKEFVNLKGKNSKSKRQIRFHSIIKKNLQELRTALKKVGVQANPVHGPVTNNTTTYYYMSMSPSEKKKLF